MKNKGVIMSDTTFLYQMPSFLNGAARTIDLFGNFTEYNFSKSPNLADTRALNRDWVAIFKDLIKACSSIIK